jgi:serine/threonine protein kinase
MLTRLMWARDLQALLIAKQVAQAMAYLHEAGHILHGDLKPSSVLFADPRHTRVVLTDIGIDKPATSLAEDRAVADEAAPLFGRSAGKSKAAIEARTVRQSFYQRIPRLVHSRSDIPGLGQGSSSTEDVVSFQCAVPGVHHAEAARLSTNGRRQVTSCSEIISYTPVHRR